MRSMRASIQTFAFQADARLPIPASSCLNDGQDFTWNMGIFLGFLRVLCGQVVGTVAAKTAA
jgi:hypothetical protein